MNARIENIMRALSGKKPMPIGGNKGSVSSSPVEHRKLAGLNIEADAQDDRVSPKEKMNDKDDSIHAKNARAEGAPEGEVLEIPEEEMSETPEEESAESPEQQAKEDEEGTEMHDRKGRLFGRGGPHISIMLALKKKR